jgi:hypothetical protein
MKKLTLENPFGPYLLPCVGFIWLSILAIFTQIQFGLALGTEKKASWFDIFVQLSPWFLNWIWLTIIIFSSIRVVNTQFSSFYVRIIIHGVLMAVLLLMYWALNNFIILFTLDREFSEYFFYLHKIILNTAQIDILIYLAVLLCSFGIYFYFGLTEKRLDLKQLQHELLNEQLKSLYSQLNPHFLFNALNTVTSLVRLRRDNEAVKALTELSKMLREILENKDNSDVKVKEEIELINCYLAIQRMRFESKLEVNVNVDEDCLNLYIPKMLLHPLVENAVQHGSQLESNNNVIDIKITQKHNQLHFRMINSAAKDDSHHGFGIGLSNTRERLSRLYDHYRFELNPEQGDHFETLLAIPIGDKSA